MVTNPGTARNTVASVENIGQVNFRTGFTFGGTEVGGLSAITYDRNNNLYYSLSDDRSQNNPARFYGLNINLTDGLLNNGDISFPSVTTLLNAAGNPFPQNSIDPEGLVLSNDRTLYLSSEGDANSQINPFVNQFSLAGRQIDRLTIPNKFLPTASGNSGIRNNAAFESLTITPNNRYLYTATENALVQDGSAADLNNESTSRIIEYNLATGDVVREIAYTTDTVEAAPIPPTGFSTNGLVELLALDNTGTLLALERSFSEGVGNTIKLYEVLTQGTTEIQNIEGLNGLDVDATAEKRLLVDFADLGITPDNVEGMTFGPILPDGRQSLILVSDNNFNPAQTTQFIALALDIKTLSPVTAADETPDEIRFRDPNNPDLNFVPDSDDPAIYLHPTDPDRSIVISTLKNAGLVVYDLQGEILQRIAPNNIRYNNVDLIYGFELGGKKVDLAVASDRQNDTLAIFSIDPTTRQLTDITGGATQSLSIFNGQPGENTAYGLAAYTSPVSGKSYIFVSQNDSNRIAQLELIDSNTRVNARVIRNLFVPIPPGGELGDAQVEGMVVDRELGYLYVAEEDVGIYKFSAEPNTSNTPTQVDADGSLKPDGNILTADVEGLTIYYGDNGTGYLLASSQGNSTFTIYDRQGSNSYLGSFFVGKNNGIDGVEESDGADVISTGLGSAYPSGLFVTQDGSNEAQTVFLDPVDLDEYQNFNTNFKFVPWENIANSFDTPLAIEPTSYDPRNPAPQELVFGSNNRDNLDAGTDPQTIDGIQDFVFTGAGADTVDISTTSVPTRGKNRIYTGSGNDEVLPTKNDGVFGGQGSDTIEGAVGSGSNRFYGGVGDDEIVVGTGDRAFGGGGNDTIEASVGGGNNRLYGNEGNDTFSLGSGDRALGGVGDDRFFASTGGGNTITGGEGVEQFWVVNLELPNAVNTITDLELATDVIGIAGFTRADLTFNQDGGNAVLGVAGTNVAIFLGISAADLQTANFVFA